MATSSILGGSRLPAAVSGKGTDALGPSDNSDSGSDAQGAYGDDEMASDSDAVGTGERASIGPNAGRTDGDILPDHIEGGEDLDEELGEDELLTSEGSGIESLAADEEDLDEEADDEVAGVDGLDGAVDGSAGDGASASD